MWVGSGIDSITFEDIDSVLHGNLYEVGVGEI
jgi:hypothetical protein